MSEYIISALDSAVSDPGAISSRQSRDKWQILPYETGEISGNLLLAGELSTPSDVTLHLGLHGWYKIFVATINMKSADYFALRLTSDRGFTGMRAPTDGQKFRWTPVEYIQEFFWRCADLSGDDIILSKPPTYFPNAAALAWVRCVPMTDEEIEREKGKEHKFRIHTHIDEDPNAEDSSDSDEALLTRVFPLGNTDAVDCSLEIAFDYDIPEYGEELPILAKDVGWQRGDESFSKVREHAYKLRIGDLHRNGMWAYATNRMSVAAFTPPYCNQMWSRRGFVENHPELYCKTRDGRTVNVCSYAYTETQDFVIDTLASYMQYGFDGVTLIFHRGMHLGFERPVLDRFAELYPEIDPHRLPVTDNRLNGIWCEIMTKFMQNLRKKLGRITINVIAEYTPETSRHFGIDVLEWARLGLIDSVYQGIMEVWEDLDGTLDESGYIDLDAYRIKLAREPIIKRFHNTNIEKTLDGAEKYLAGLAGTGVTFAASMPWPHRVTPAEYSVWKDRLTELGIRDLFAWNTNHMMYDLTELHAATLSGDRLTSEHYTARQHRVLSIAGSDISTFDPNWRG